MIMPEEILFGTEDTEKETLQRNGAAGRPFREAFMTILVFLGLTVLVWQAAGVLRKESLAECRDEQLLILFDDEVKADCIILNEYYELPCKAEVFLEKGWMIADLIEAHKRAQYVLTYKNMKIRCDIVNMSNESISVSEGLAVRIQIYGGEGNMAVIRKGVNLSTPARRIRTLLTEAEESSGTFSVCSDNVEYIRICPDRKSKTNEITISAWSEEKINEYPDQKSRNNQ